MKAAQIEGAVPARRLGRSVAAVVAGFVAVVALSLATDQAMHMLKVYPPWGQPLFATGPLLLALAYRCVYAVFGSWLAARLAPGRPMRHALALGAVGFVVSLLGAAATIPLSLGPVWYPVSLIITALPCAWLGGLIHGEPVR
ncbi:MAG: hypothetical protein H6P99_2174 [Holophagaceae bacterium]|nr:hypothetical protein [Holophagaceae bacterium]